MEVKTHFWLGLCLAHGSAPCSLGKGGFLGALAILEDWIAVLEVLELLSLEGLLTRLRLKLEVVELVKRLPANPLPRAEHYSIFEAHGSFSLVGDGPSGLRP